MYRFFEQLLDPFPAQQPRQPPATLTAFCLHACRGAWPWLFLMSALSALIAVIEVAMYGLVGRLVDTLSSVDRSEFSTELLPEFLLWGGLIAVVFPVAAVLQNVLVHQTLMGNLPMAIRWNSHRYVLEHAVSFFHNEYAGRIGTKVMQTSLAVRETVIKLMDILVYVIVYLISVLIMVAAADVRLMLPLGAWLLFYIATLCYFVPRLRDIASRQADARASMTGRVIDSYTNISTVKLFSHAGREAAYARDSMDGFLQTAYEQMRKSASFQICVDISGIVLLVVVVVVSIYLWLDDAITVGAIAVATAVVLRLQGLSHWIMWEVATLFENIGIVRDGINTLSLAHTVRDEPHAQPLQPVSGDIEFDHVTFDYGSNLAVIRELSLVVPAGEKVGLVGPSGAGKSTLVNLLLRLYDVPEGKIRVDGQWIGQVTQQSLRANIGVVSQDTSLLHRSVYDNIAYGKREATREEVIDAARRADAHGFITGLRDPQGREGYDAHVGERGVNLSGGQRQRIAIARVFLKNAPILILDEATSALDSEVEAAIQENLRELMRGKTVIAIAHRLSTIAAMDRLVTISDGRIVESGSHSELVAAGGLYASLWQRQSGGFITS